MTNHILNDQLYVMSASTMESLPEDLQQVVRDAAKEAAEYHTKLFVDEEAGLIEFFKENKVTVTEPNLDEFRAAMQPVYDRYIAKNKDVAKNAIKEINAVR